MNRFLSKFEKTIVYTLIIVAVILISLQTVGLIWELFKSVIIRIREVGLDYNPEYGKTVVVLFFNIILSLEILETIKIFHQRHELKIRIILIVCIIAISRKVLAMDVSHSDPVAELATAGMILAFAGSYFLLRRSDKLRNKLENDNFE